MRSWQAMVQVAMSTKTKKVGAAARQSYVLPPRSEGVSYPPMVFNRGVAQGVDFGSRAFIEN